MNEFACACGMPRIVTPCFPRPFTTRWHILHRKVHLATFPNVDQVTIENLDLAIEWSRHEVMV